MAAPEISVIVPTIGRPAHLRELLKSLSKQGFARMEVIVADASVGEQVGLILADSSWAAAGLSIVHEKVSPPNAVRQRSIAIGRSSGRYLLLLDDDIVLEDGCVERMFRYL